MIMRATLAAAAATAALLTAPGCAVTRGQQTVGAYVDDVAITIAIKNQLTTNKDVDISAISVETLNGIVTLSGFVRNATDRTTADSIARTVNGVSAVMNEIAIRP